MAASAVSLEYSCPVAVAERIRFFNSRLRRIAPNTHQDQASGDLPAIRLSPWWRDHPRRPLVPQCVHGGVQELWLPMPWRQSMSGSHCRRSASTAHQGTAARAPIQVLGLKTSSQCRFASRRRQLLCEASSHIKWLLLLQHMEAGCYGARWNRFGVACYSRRDDEVRRAPDEKYVVLSSARRNGQPDGEASRVRTPM